MFNIRDFEEKIKKDFEKSSSELYEFHEKMMSILAKRAMTSPLYKGRIREINNLEEVRELPLTSYEEIKLAINKFGLENILLNPYVKYWQTSGYSGEPKKFYFAKEDLEEIVKMGSYLAYIYGLREGDVIWNLCAPEPYISGSLLGMIAKKMGYKEVMTPLSKREDIIKALKIVSRIDKINAIAGTPVVFTLVGEWVNEQNILKDLVKEKIEEKIKIGCLSNLLTKFYLKGINHSHIRKLLFNVEKAIMFGEMLQPYKELLKKSYPKVEPREMYGCTEIMIGAAQFSEKEGMSVMLNWVFPEIAEPKEVQMAKEDKSYRPKTIPWWNWYKGLKGELIVTKNWYALPLIRYPTGDIVKVLEPKRKEKIELGTEEVEINYPVINVIGRSSELLDFSAPDEDARVMGLANIYSRDVKEAMSNVQKWGKVKWWELYLYENETIQIRDSLTGGTKKIKPITKLTIEVIPEVPVHNLSAYKEEIIKNLRGKCKDLDFLLSRLEDTYSLRIVDHLIEINILEQEAYKKVEEEIEKRIKEGRPLGQIKPKQIHIIRKEI